MLGRCESEDRRPMEREEVIAIYGLGLRAVCELVMALFEQVQQISLDWIVHLRGCGRVSRH